MTVDIKDGKQVTADVADAIHVKLKHAVNVARKTQTASVETFFTEGSRLFYQIHLNKELAGDILVDLRKKPFPVRLGNEQKGFFTPELKAEVVDILTSQLGEITLV